MNIISIFKRGFYWNQTSSFKANMEKRKGRSKKNLKRKNKKEGPALRGIKMYSRLGTVAHTCNLITLGGQGG